jgi:hypothetical protein
VAVEQLFTNTAYRTGSGTAPQSDDGVDKGFGGMIGGCVAVVWRVWVTLLVVGVVSMGCEAVVWRVWGTWVVFVMELRCRFRIWCVIVAVGWRVRGARLVCVSSCGKVVGWGGGSLGLGFACGGRRRAFT